MTADRFEAQVEKWARKSRARMTAVFRESAQTLANEVRKPKGEGGNMPIVTGNLRRSLMASTSSMPSIKQDEQEFGDKSGEIKLTIAGAEIGETIYLGFQAIYARRMEYGFQGQDSRGRTYNQQGSGFVRLTAQRWPQIVDESVRSVKARVVAR